VKSTDLVRQILDLIDSLDNDSSHTKQDDYVEPDSEAARMRQIVRFSTQTKPRAMTTPPTSVSAA